MNWIKITIAADNIDETCVRLSALGYDQVEIDDPDELSDFLQNKKPYWQLAGEDLLEGHTKSVGLYVAEDADLSVFGEFDYTSSVVRDSDWNENWKKYYKPILVGRRVLIQPEWEPLDNPEGRAVFLCDPGVSFGTGTHATTRMCLEFLDEIVRDGDTVADLGCGSGILSVVAMLLGASCVRAFDIDPQAVDTALKNAALNSVELEANTADLLEDNALWKTLAEHPANIVCANLVADLITSLGERLKTAVTPGGNLLISGVLEENADNVCGILEGVGFRVKNKKFSEGWFAAQLTIDNK